MKSIIITQIFILWSCILVFSQVDCEKYADNYIPRDLFDAISFLDCVWSDTDKESFKNQSENEAITHLHFGTGQTIRNNWGLWDKRNNKLKKYFVRMGIHHPDDISTIILTSFHRHLNNKDIKLENQVKYFKEYWQRIEDEQKYKKNLFKSLSVGDTVRVPFGTISSGGKNSLNVYSDTFTVTDINDYDCIISGVITRKPRNGYTLKIRVTETCQIDNAYYGGEKMEIGHQFNYAVKYFKILTE